jgi:methionyl-tRNA formyltransferase
MLLSRAEAIHADDTTGSLHDRLAQLGAEMIVEALRALPGGLTATPQPADGVTYAAKIGKAEASVDWTARPPRSSARSAPSTPSPAPSPRCETPVKLWRARAIDASGTPGEVLLAEGAGVIVACGEGSYASPNCRNPAPNASPPPTSCAACRLPWVAALLKALQPIEFFATRPI